MKGKAFWLLLAVLVSSLPAAPGKTPRFGAGVRFSSFGLPDALLDLALDEHPRLWGNSYSFEIHSFGKNGPRSALSGVYCLEYSRMDGAGVWRVDDSDPLVSGSGEATQVNFTASLLVHVFPSSPVHPYLGGGIGVGRISVWAEGTYTNEFGTLRETYEKKTFLPVIHFPVGIIANFNDKFLARVEAGFKNGFYFGGGLVLNF
jgi:hypothetical protein